MGQVTESTQSTNGCKPKTQLSTEDTTSDCIRRAEAIDALWKALYAYEDKTEKQFQESDELDVSDWIEHRIFVQNMSDIDRQTILALPSAQPEQQWIPCIERPPEDDNVYFVTVHPDYIVPGGLSVDTLHWYDGKWWFDYYGQPAEFTDPIIAWMPLPEPWKGEER